MDTQAIDPETSRPSPFRRLRTRPVLLGGIVGGIGVAVFVLVWFQPQTLLFDDAVDEAFPIVEAAADGAADTSDASDGEGMADDGGDDVGEDPEVSPEVSPEASPPTDEGMDDVEAPVVGPMALSEGSFGSRNRYTVTGTATVYELEDRSRLLRLEDFQSTNGPDLFVYLTAGDSADDDETLDADAVNLGVLTGNIGDQNYTIPDDVDLERYDTVVIWCLRFSVGFGAADLAPVGAGPGRASPQ